ncbi:MAG: GAF domain-containing protein [Anaerolineae bacterium]
MMRSQDWGDERGPQQDETQPRIGFLARLWARIITPHPTVTDIGERRRAQLTMGLAFAVTATNLAGLFAAFGVSGAELSIVLFAGLFVACVIAYSLGRTKLYAVGAVLLPVSLSLFSYSLVLVGSQDPSISLYSAIPAALVIGSGLLPFGGLVVLVLGNIVLTGLLPLFTSGMAMSSAGRDAGIFLSIGGLLIVITAFRNGLERARLAELQEANRELTDIRTTLERRVAERTADLERRSLYLSAAAQVSRSVSSILDPDRLIRTVVELIRERFGLYYVGLFQVDEYGEWAVLQAGTGQAGEAMRARGHRIAVGEGMVGWSIANAKARVASQAEADEVRLSMAELPNTRSEAALPLRTRGQVIGALTVQSDRVDAFDEVAMAALQTMADQVSVALDNARLFESNEAVLEETRQTYRELTRGDWLKLLASNQEMGYRFAERDVTQVEDEWPPEMVRAVQTGQRVVEVNAKEAVLSVPLRVRDQVIGVLDLRKPSSAETWTDEERLLIETLADQLGAALESARLYQDTRRRAAREQLVGEVTGRIRETLDLNAVLQTAVREMGLALDVDVVEVRLGTGTDIPGANATPSEEVRP